MSDPTPAPHHPGSCPPQGTDTDRRPPHPSSAGRPRTGGPEPIALWIVGVPDLGGVARHVLDAARAGIPGWRLAVLCDEGPLAQRLRAQGSAVTTGPFGPSAGLPASLRTLGRAVSTLGPAVVHSHLAYADIVLALARLPKGTRRFTTEHGIAGEDLVYHGSGVQSRIMELAHRARFRRFDGAAAVSHATRKAMIRKWKVHQRIAVIPNGVDLPPGTVRRDPDRDVGMRVLSLARLAPEKRIDKLIEAFALVAVDCPDATLTIAGEGPLGDELAVLASRLGVADAVAFPGFVDPEKAMASTDIVAQLSVWENCSYTLLDAAARGLRIVATDVGGNREITGPEGLVQGWDPHTIARALRGCVASPSPQPTTVARMCEDIAALYTHEERKKWQRH